MAEIKVRVDPAMKKKITSMAKKKNMTQNAFMNLHLERIANQNLFQEERNRYEEILGIYANVFATFASSNDELLQRLIAIEQLLHREMKKTFEKGDMNDGRYFDS